MTDDEIRKHAEEVGLARAASDHFDAMKAGIEHLATIRDRLGRELTPADEPALVFRPGEAR